MSNFNEYFKEKGVKEFVDKFYKGVDIYNNDVKITNISYEILTDEDSLPVSYYVENGLTGTHKVRVDYQLSNDKTGVYSTMFEIPKEFGGVFVIEGAYRVPTNKLNQDFDCRIKMSGLKDKTIRFDYSRTYHIDSKKLVIKKRDFTANYGLNDKTIEIDLDDIDNVEGADKEEWLKLTDLQRKKFEVKLDLDYHPEYISKQLIEDCIAFGDDRLRDLIVDKKIDPVSIDFMNYIFKDNNCRNLYRTKRTITSYFTKFGKIQEESNAITNLAVKFFKGSSEKKAGDSGVQVPPGVNAMNLESIGDKITIPCTVAYNKTFADIIDIVDTPINQNTNLQNALTVSTHIKEDGVYFDVYDLKFKKITIPYIDYLNSKVVASEYVDYEKKELKPNDNNQVEVKYRMRRKMVDLSEIQLIDLHPDYRLSSMTRRLPFINSTDSVRLSMGTSMLKQSIPLPNAQRSLVDTGNNDELPDNVLNEKFRYPKGKVKKITEMEMIFELPDGKEVSIPRRTAIQSINDVSVYIEPKVKVGQVVKEGDVIAGTPEIPKTMDTYKSGLNTLVLFHAYFGKINEDALVISQSYAERMESYSIIDLNLDIKTTGAIKWIAPVGTKLKSGDSVMTIYRTFKLDEVNRAINEKLGGIFGGSEEDITKYTVEDYLKIPNNIDECYVSDVMIQKNVAPKIPRSTKKPDYSFSSTSDKVIKEYMDNMSRKPIYDRFPEYVAADRLRPINLDSKDFKIAYTVRIRIIKRTLAMIGSKITNRYGGKGVVSEVVPDELMPIMVDKASGKKYRVEVVMNPYSTVNRKIPGVLMESDLGYIAHKLYELVEKYKTSETGKKKIMPMINKYYRGRYEKLDVDEFIKLHETKPLEEVYYFNVGSYSSYSLEEVESWMDELGIESQSEILMPETQLTDLDELKETLSPEEYEKVVKNMSGKFIKVGKRLQCGWLTLIQLYHIPSYSNKVFSSLFGNEIDPRRDEPVMGKGRYRRGEGQKIGEQELSVLLARNARDFIDSAKKDTVREDNQLFLNNLLGLGLTITDDRGYRQGGSSYKDQLNKLKTKFRLKGQK